MLLQLETGDVGVLVLLNYLIELIIYQQLAILEEFNLLLAELSQTFRQETCMQPTLEEFAQVKLQKARIVVW